MAAWAGDGCVLQGRCEAELSLVQPYGPFGRWLDELAGLGIEPPSWALQVTAPLRNDGPKAAPLSGVTGLDSVVLRDAIRAWLIAGSQRRPLLVLLDDFQWAGSATRQLVGSLAHELPERGVLIVAAKRTEGADPPLHPETPVGRVELGPLGRQAVRALLGPTLPTLVADRIEQLARGNPFLALAAARQFAMTGRIELGDGARDAVQDHIQRLGPDTPELLAVAALTPGAFRADVLADVTGHRLSDTWAALVRARDAGLLTTPTPGRWRFSHDLVREALAASVAPADRHAWQAQLVAGLARAGDGNAPAWLALAGRGGDVDDREAVRALVAAGDSALATFAPAEAATSYEQALRLMQRSPLGAGDGPEGVSVPMLDVAIRHARALTAAGDPGWRSRALDVAEAAERVGAVDQLVEAVLIRQRLMSAAGQAAVEPRHVALLERALEAVGGMDSVRRARLLAVLADALQNTPEYERRIGCSDEAEAIADRLGLADEDRAPLLVLRAATFAGAGAVAPRRRAVEALVRVVDRSGVAPVGTHIVVVPFYAAAGDRARVEEWMEAGRQAAGDPRLPLLPWTVAIQASWWAAAHGRFEEAEHQALRALAAGTRVGVDDAAVVFGSLMLSIRALQGRPADLPVAQAQSAPRPAPPSYVAFAALGAALNGDSGQARSLLEDALAARFRSAVTAPIKHALLISWAIAATAVGHRPAAAELLRILEPDVGSFVSTTTSLAASVDHYCGQLALTCGDPGRAEHHLAAASRLNRRLGATLLVAQEDLLRAQVLRSRPNPDLLGAAAAAERTLHWATEHGARPLANAALGELREIAELQRG